MTISLIAMLLVLAGLTANFLTEGYMAGWAIGMIVFVPALFATSLLFSKLIGLDRRIREQEIASLKRKEK